MSARHFITCVLAVLSITFASSAQAGERWDALWRNADQRGEQLLHDGKAAAAARSYRDPRRKAYAELAAGNYKAAAQGFAAFDDSESQYNLGNALAHNGDLNSALKAYDAALAKDPHNGDAKHNRDLVEKALKQQQQQKDTPQSQQKNQQQDAQDNKQDQKQSSLPDQKQSDQKSSAQQDGSDQTQNKKTTDTQPTAPSQQDKSTQQKQQAHDKAQAQQDAQQAADAATQQPQAGSNTPRSATQAETPKSEQQLAEEQWLRQIPDDPGGLLRRKFMIEHLMRKQQDQQK